MVRKSFWPMPTRANSSVKWACSYPRPHAPSSSAHVRPAKWLKSVISAWTPYWKDELKDHTTEFFFAVGKQLSERLLQTSRKVSHLAFFDVTGRVASTLLDLCEQPDVMTHPDGMQIRITRQEIGRIVGCSRKRVFGLVIDFGTSQSPKSTRPLTTYLCPSRPGHPALRNNFASSLLLRTCLPMTGRRVRRPTLFSLWRKARRENSAASRLLGSTSLRFALHGWQRRKAPSCRR